MYPNPKIHALDGIMFAKSCSLQKFQHGWPSDPEVIVTVFWETVEPDQWQHHLEQLLKWQKQTYPDQKVFVALNIWYKNWNWACIQQHVQDVVFVDFFLLYVWLVMDQYQLVPRSPTWNADSDKFLFLIGKPYKINRIRLLWKLYQLGALSHAVYSFGVSDSDFHLCRAWIPELSDQEFEDFVKAHSQTLDLDKSMLSHGEVVGAADIYRNYSFGVVSESDFDRLHAHPWITEKTWLHIANRLPFIVAGEHHTTSLLEDMGIDTFRNQLPIPNYDDPARDNYQMPTHYHLEHARGVAGWKEFYQGIRDPAWPEESQLDQADQQIVNEILAAWQAPILSDTEWRLNCIATNVLYWSRTHEWKSTVKPIVEKNYLTYLELGKTEFHALDTWLRGANLNAQVHNIVLHDSRFQTIIQKTS